MGDFEAKVVAPIVFVAVGAIFVLLGEISMTRGDGEARRGHALLAGVAAASLALAAYAASSAFADGTNAVFDARHPMLRLDPLSSYLSTVVGIAALFSVGLSVVYLKVLDIDHGEFYALLLLSTAGMFALVAAVDLIAIFIGLELMTIPVTVLSAFDRSRLRSNEAGLKYLILGGFASALLVYGMALLYGTTGTTQLAGIRAAFDPNDSLMLCGLGLVFVGFAFKVGAVPFHQWVPDVYEGAPTIVTAFMSVAVKTAGFAILLRFMVETIPDSGVLLGTVLSALAVASMIVGNVMAVIQTDVKRMMAYSSVAHGGYLLLGIATGTIEAYTAVLLYIPIYVFMNLGAFGVMISLAQGGRECDRFDDFNGLARERPALAAVMTLFLLSLAGVPGTAGFIAKFDLFHAAISAGRLGLTAVALVTTAISLYYYLRLPVAMYMRDADHAPRPAVIGSHMGFSEQIVLALCVVAVLLFGVLPSNRWAPLTEWAEAALSGLPF